MQNNSWLEEFAAKGWVILPKAIPLLLCQALAGELLRRHAAGLFSAARISKQLLRQENIRSDSILWLDASDQLALAYFEFMGKLRLTLNEYFLLPLNSYEAHFACYEPGAFYQKHRDTFQGDSARQISTVLFLNESWLMAEAGELLIYDRDCEGLVASRIMPEIGNMVLFMSETIVHEVLPTLRRRLSLTGWFKVLAADDVLLRG